VGQVGGDVPAVAGVIFAWDLGGNVGASYLFGTYLNDLNAGRGGGLGGVSFRTPVARLKVKTVGGAATSSIRAPRTFHGVDQTRTGTQTTTVPGEQVGLAVGAPLPEGIYAINTFTYRSPKLRRTKQPPPRPASTCASMRFPSRRHLPVDFEW
jgi:hypothetical protein